MVGAAVSDIDGDHRDDVVYTARTGDGGYDGFGVLRSTGTGLEPGVVWAETPRCGRVGCLLYFQNGY